MKEKFIQLLKANNAYENFINNLERENNYSSIDHLCRVESAPDWIDSSFTWKNTPQGKEYWESIANLWWDIVCDAML